VGCLAAVLRQCRSLAHLDLGDNSVRHWGWALLGNHEKEVRLLLHSVLKKPQT
jgi:hypothetical protein